jgi:selenide,water dikinase
VVGGGAGGVELTLAMQHRLRRELQALGRNPDELVFHLFTRDRELMPTHNAGVRRRFAACWRSAGAGAYRHRRARGHGRQLTTAAGHLAADEIVWVTQAGGPAWLQGTGLALDDNGFVRVNAGCKA